MPRTRWKYAYYQDEQKFKTRQRKEYFAICFLFSSHALLPTPCRPYDALLLTQPMQLVGEHTDLQIGVGFGEFESKIHSQ